MGNNNPAELRAAAVKLREDVEGKKLNLSASLFGLGTAFDEFHDFFLLSTIDTTPLLINIRDLFVEAHTALKLVTRVSGQNLQCNNKKWDVFVVDLNSLLRSDFVTLIEHIKIYIGNVQDIELKDKSLSVADIVRKNNLYSQNRKQIIEALANIHDMYSALIANLEWHN